jgi:GrpB-like predicted nucleotidyltransferase (UPF0157 family)
VDLELQQRLESLGIDPNNLTDPAGAWLLLFARYGTRVTISDRYALEAAVLGITPDQLPTDVKDTLGREVLESQFPGIELIGEPSGAPVEIVAYNPQWPEAFAGWHDRLQQVVPAATLIAHVGSTAVPGLAAKPIVDIQTSVPDVADEAAYVAGIESLGAPLRSRDPGHRYFRPPHDQPRLVHIHVCQAGSKWEGDHLLFRDYLRTHDAVRDSYGQLKLRLAMEHREDRLAYTDAKTNFILDTMEQARAWACQTGWTVPTGG